MRMFSLATLVALTLSACADPATTQKLADLEGRIVALETAKAALPANVEKGGADDAAAMELYKQANEAFRGGDTAKAKELLTELNGKYAGSRPAQAGQRLLDQLSVVGKKIEELAVTEWFQGDVKLSSGKASLLVFWEVWCPHCKREVPKLQATYEKYKDQGLNVVGLTKLTRDKTPEEVRAFIAENKVGYPTAKEDGSMSDFFGVSGVPAAAVVKGGEVVWRGHPAQITDEMITGWLQ